MDTERDRELLEEIRLDVKSILSQMPRFVTWAKLGGAAATISGLIIAAVKLF
jgi:hypothetical protein